MVHQQPKSRGAHEQIAPLGAVSSPDLHGHERSFVGGLASDKKLAGSGHTDDGKRKGRRGCRGEREKEEERRKKRDRKEKKEKKSFLKNTNKNENK